MNGPSSIFRSSVTFFKPVVVPVTGANNGVSLAGTIVQLGNGLGGVGATLLSDRFIPMAGFKIVFVGENATGFPVFQSAPVHNITAPFWQAQDSTGAELASLKMTDNTSIFLGAGNAVANTNAAGQRTVAIGFQALMNCPICFENVAVGFLAMQQNTLNGIQNTAVGSAAMQNNTSGGQNVGVGWTAAIGNTTGSRNMSIGGNTLGQNQTGSDNCAIGNNVMTEQLLGATTNPAQNVGIGSNAMQQLAPGTNNVVIGFKACFDNSLGTNCIYIGANCAATGAAVINNSTLIGQGMLCSLSNVAMLGRADQVTVIGSSNVVAVTTSTLQVVGNFNTAGAAPLTAGAGQMDFGNIVNAASVLNAARYWEVSIGGVLFKVCIN
jgi:hypothetical protein